MPVGRIENLLAKQGKWVQIVGYGSLLSRASIERTIGGPVRQHSLVRIPGYVRVFDKVCVHSIETGAADPSSVEIACCCAQERQGGELLVSLSVITRGQVLPLLERESVYAISEVSYEALDGRDRGRALMFVRPPGADSHSNDAPIKISRGRGGPVAYSGPLWRTDVLPARTYLQRCIRAAREMGESVLDNFLDHSFLADRTLLRSYLVRYPDITGDEDVHV